MASAVIFVIFVIFLGRRSAIALLFLTGIIRSLVLKQEDGRIEKGYWPPGARSHGMEVRVACPWLLAMFSGGATSPHFPGARNPLEGGLKIEWTGGIESGDLR